MKMLTLCALLCIANFVYIYLKAGQQLNVVQNEKMRVPAFTLGMAACEVFLWGSVAKVVITEDWWWAIPPVLAITVGGTLGCWLQMHHNGQRGKYEHLNKTK